MKLKLNLLLVLTVLLLAPSAYTSTPEQRGLEIAQKMENANNGFLGETSSMVMTLISAYGQKTIREMKGKIMEVSDDGDQSLINFQRPSDVKGTKMLTWSHKRKDDDQWLYLPSMRKTKRISSKSKTSSFMGSEFSYEDLGSQEIEKYNFKHIRDEKDIWILERHPKNKKASGYSKQIMWVLKRYHNPQKIEYYDRKNELLKTAEFKNYKSYKIKNKTLWRPSSIHMKNIQTKKESIFVWKDRKLGLKMKKRDFSKSSLKR
ncbi:MAG: outer membrane lipoprotein-sorting protein [Bacteriovoracaceae bacterium]|nr:outer membrane lipoprotein-sorting protein [Bacteriovoracaceae bacterium]